MNEASIGDIAGENGESSKQRMEPTPEGNEREIKQLPQKKSKKRQKWKKMDLSLEPTSHHVEVTQLPPKDNAWSTKLSSGSAPQDNVTTRYYSNQPSQKTEEEKRQEMIQQAAGMSNSHRENVALSKALARLLRHHKPRDIPIDDEGYALIDHILQHREFARFSTTVSEINCLVNNNSKKRFEIMTSAGKSYKIKATQGHSIQFKNLELELIRDPHKHGVVVHGTYKENWRKIKKEGLSRLGRTHIHFAIGLIGQSHVTSGMRYSCDTIIYLDMEKAMKDGLKFYESSNNVVLSEGNEFGVILPKYFSKVTQWNERERDWFEVEFNKE